MRGESGKLPSTWISLSVKSMASWGCSGDQISKLHELVIWSKRATSSRTSSRGRTKRREKLTPATPKFSIAGILCPIACIPTQHRFSIYQLCSLHALLET